MRYFKLFLLTVLVFLFSGCAIYHHYPRYYGRIIDADTRKPLEGVVVLAEYYTWSWGSPGGPVGYFLDTQEMVTDIKGEFHIPSMHAFAFRLGTFEANPGFKIFKPRYTCSGGYIPDNVYYTVELRELKTREERINNVGCYPVNVPDHKMKKLAELNNIDRAALGMSPTHLQEPR